MKNRIHWTLAAIVGLAAAGCSTFTAGGARPAYVRDAMRDYRFPVACEALWVDALKVVASQGFDLVGTDRELAGQEKQGFITNVLNAGHATTKDDKGVYESESDFDNARLRFQIRARRRARTAACSSSPGSSRTGRTRPRAASATTIRNSWCSPGSLPQRRPGSPKRPTSSEVTPTRRRSPG
jgi:hypothetical protein